MRDELEDHAVTALSSRDNHHGYTTMRDSTSSVQRGGQVRRRAAGQWSARPDPLAVRVRPAGGEDRLVGEGGDEVEALRDGGVRRQDGRVLLAAVGHDGGRVARRLPADRADPHIMCCHENPSHCLLGSYKIEGALVVSLGVLVLACVDRCGDRPDRCLGEALDGGAGPVEDRRKLCAGF